MLAFHTPAIHTEVGSHCTACLLRGAIIQVMFDDIYNGSDIGVLTATDLSTLTWATLCPGTVPQLQR